MALFAKKEPGTAAVPPLPESLPTDRVMQMKGQGFTNNQIITALQKDGFNSQQIFDAMKQADLNQAVGSPIPQESPLPPPGTALPPDSDIPPPDMPPPMDMMPPMGQPADSERIEQIAEAIIDEKWEEIAKSINKILEWKDNVESRINEIQGDLKRVKEDFDRLHGSILGKIGEYDQNILNVGTEIKTMEKVFQKILPTLTDNVNQLTRLTSGMKGKKTPPSR